MSGSSAPGDSAATLAAVQRALRLAMISLPHIAGLAHAVRISVDARVATIGVFPSGRMVVNPRWFASLEPPDAAFVVAHELLHLALDTHQRGEGSDQRRFNMAHDYIINDLLEEALGRPAPANGLRWPYARHHSAEQLMHWLNKADEATPSWGGAGIATDTPLGAALRAAGLGQPAEGAQGDSDVLTETVEREWFPGDAHEDAQRRRQISEAARQAVSLELLRERMAKVEKGAAGSEAGDVVATAEALRRIYSPPWELALQSWMEAVAPGPRSYARPSRRVAGPTDAIQAGRRREGWTLHIVLDTSGSMTEEIPRVLGAIAAFCESTNVNTVHILQCDVEVTSDEWVSPAALDSYEVAGFGGSDMSAAMYELARDPEVKAAIVITDGYIVYPESPMPYNVLWALTEESEFEPPYGRVLQIPPANAMIKDFRVFR